MRIGSLFSGIGGLELGLEWAGLGRTVWQVESNAFCRSILSKHWPEVKRHEQIETVGAECLERVDLICGGFPCQDISSAGKGAGLDGDRSGLWFEMARVIRELRPRFVVIENVAALVIRGLDHVLSDLAAGGYDAIWLPLRAADVGAPHRRERIFIVAWRLDDAHGGRRWARTATNAEGARSRGSTGSGDGCDRMADASGNRNEAQQRSTESKTRAVTHTHGANDVADSDSRRREGWRLPQHTDEQSSRGTQSDRRGDDRGVNWPPGPNGDWDAYVRAGGPEPVVRRGTHGIPNRAHRLRALGNSVVPQCAEVIGHIIKQLESRGPQ